MDRWLSLLIVLLLPATGLAQASGNLLRNANFQDDWLTLIPETKNHHWCYSSEFYHRRDFNPDGWTCKGSWQWLDADAPAGQRRLFVSNLWCSALYYGDRICRGLSDRPAGKLEMLPGLL